MIGECTHSRSSWIPDCSTSHARLALYTGTSQKQCPHVCAIRRGRHWMREVAPVSQTGQPEASLRPSADVARQDYAIPMPVSTHGQNPGHHENQTTGRCMRLGKDSQTGAELYGAMDRKDTEARKILFFRRQEHRTGVQTTISGGRLDLRSRRLETRGFHSGSTNTQCGDSTMGFLNAQSPRTRAQRSAI